MNKNRKTIKMPVRYLMNAVLVALLFVALSYLTRNILSTYQNKVLMTVGINIILAVSLNVATGYLGQLPLGHAGFMAVGAYTCAYIKMLNSTISQKRLISLKANLFLCPPDVPSCAEKPASCLRSFLLSGR